MFLHLFLLYTGMYGKNIIEPFPAFYMLINKDNVNDENVIIFTYSDIRHAFYETSVVKKITAQKGRTTKDTP